MAKSIILSALPEDKAGTPSSLSKEYSYRNLVTATQIAEAASEIANEVSVPIQSNRILDTDSHVHAALSGASSTDDSLEYSHDYRCGTAALAFLSEKVPTSQNWTAREKLAGCLWSALAFQAELGSSEQQAFRRKLISISESCFLTMSDIVRTRIEVSVTHVLAFRSENLEQTLYPVLGELCDAINALRHNATLDNEERELVHLLVAGHSELVKEPFSSLADPLRTIVLGIETAFKLIHPPCDRHAALVTGQVREDAQMNLHSVISFIGTLGTVLTRRFNVDMLQHYPLVFPLLSGLASGRSKLNGSSTMRTAAEWGCRALLEAAIYNLLIGRYEQAQRPT